MTYKTFIFYSCNVKLVLYNINYLIHAFLKYPKFVIFNLSVYVKANNDPEIESKYHHYNLICVLFYLITHILSLQDGIIIRSMFFSYIS